jgi:hypothetical protein
LEHFDCIWNIWVVFGTFGLHLEHLDCICNIWIAFGTFGLHLDWKLQEEI